MLFFYFFCFFFFKQKTAYEMRISDWSSDVCSSDLIVPVTATMTVVDKATGETSRKEVTLTRDEGSRADTSAEGLAALKPVIEGGVITAGNASQLSDGASACVVMEAALAAKRGLAPLGRYVGMALAGTEPEAMGIGQIGRAHV